MPTYVWKCEKCGNKHESIRAITDNSKEACKRKGCKGKCHKTIQHVAIKFNTRMS